MGETAGRDGLDAAFRRASNVSLLHKTSCRGARLDPSNPSVKPTKQREIIHTESESNTHWKYGSSAKAVWMMSMAPGISDFDSGTTSIAMLGLASYLLGNGDNGGINGWMVIWGVKAWAFSICKSKRRCSVPLRLRQVVQIR